MLPTPEQHMFGGGSPTSKDVHSSNEQRNALLQKVEGLPYVSNVDWSDLIDDRARLLRPLST